MSVKLYGAAMIIAACGGVGCFRASAYKKEEQILGDLIVTTETMILELRYCSTPLPELCRSAASNDYGPVGQVLRDLADRLEENNAPCVSDCMSMSIEHVSRIPDSIRSRLELLGQSLGRFDLEGQIQGLEHFLESCRNRAKTMANDSEQRIRSFRTLGFCAGSALAILFL